MYYEIIIVGLILSADSFSAAVAMGLRPFSKKDAFKFAFSSGGAEALVTLIGAMAGLHLISKIESFDHWIAFILLMGVALHMAYEGFCDLMSKEVKAEKLDFHGFAKVLIVSFATSLDAFGVGIGLGVAEKPITPYVFSIGIWAFISTIVGLYLAKKLSKKSFIFLFWLVLLQQQFLFHIILQQLFRRELLYKIKIIFLRLINERIVRYVTKICLVSNWLLLFLFRATVCSQISHFKFKDIKV